MSTITSGMAYPFDPTGSASTNQITNETHVLTAVTWGGYHFIVPRWAPFFADSVALNFKAANGTYKPLVEGIDYYFSHEFISASRACAKRVYGSITFLDPTLAGVLTIQKYNTIGDVWTQDTLKISEILADELHNPRTTTWESVINMPYSFPVIDHAWDLVDMVGMKDVVAAIQAIEAQLRATGQQGLADHIANKSNPHQVTAAQVGLDQVQNFPLATIAQAVAGTLNTAYITPMLMQAALDQGPNADIAAHIADTTNPHKVTAAQTGAYSKTEADNLLAGKLDKTARAADTALFAGYRPTDYAAYVLQGTAANSNLFAGMDPTAFKEYLSNGAAADTEKFNGMTYDQVKADILSGQAASTASFGGYSFSDMVNYILGQKATDTSHFNGLTYDQVKADILTGTAANSILFNGYTYAQVASQILAGQSADTLKFNGKTYAQVKADMLSGSTDATTFGGYSVDQYATFVLQGKAADSALFNGLTPAQFSAQVLQGTAANATLINGLSIQDILNQVSVTNAVVEQSATPYTTGETAAPRWLAIGRIWLPNSTSEYSAFSDAQWLVTGLDYSGGIDSECHHVRVSGRTATGPGVRIIVTNLGGPRATDNQYGYTLASAVDPKGATRQQATVYVKLDANHSEVSLTALTASEGELLYNRVADTTEPTGIVYVANAKGTDTLVHQSDLGPINTSLAALATQVSANQSNLQGQIDALTASFQALVTQFS